MIPIILWLIFVQPKGEAYTPQEQAYTIQQVKEATAFWGYEADIRTAMLLTDKAVFELPIDQWAAIPTGNTGITIFVVDTSKGDQLFFDSYGGYAQRYYQIITAVRNNNLGATVAHELGHVMYGLPDWYLQAGKCVAIDIMCDAVTAYNRKIKGCLTLDFLGTPCYTLHVPLIIGANTNGSIVTDAGRHAETTHDQSRTQPETVTKSGSAGRYTNRTSGRIRRHEHDSEACHSRAS